MILHWRNHTTSHLGIFYPARNRRETFAYIFFNVLANRAVVDLFTGVKHEMIMEPIPVQVQGHLSTPFALVYDTSSKFLTIVCPVPANMENKFRDFLERSMRRNPYHTLVLQCRISFQQWEGISRTSTDADA